MRRILLLITDLKIGGTPTVVRELAMRLSHRGDAVVEVACLAPWGPVADPLRDAGVGVTALGATGASDLPRAVRSLISLIRARRFDTVVSFLVHANAVAALASVACGSVRFIQSIQTTQPRPRWHWLVQAAAARAAETIIVPSESVARVAREWALVPSARIAVIPNAVDVEVFRSTGVPPVSSGGSAGSAVVLRGTGVPPVMSRGTGSPVGFIGRLDPVKRIDDAIRATAELNGLIHLHIYGEGSERTGLARLAGELAIEKLVTFHGAVARPQDALREIDLLVLPSEAEGFGLVLIEAMAAGVPIVATRAPGICDVVRDGRTGLLVPIGSPRELAQAIRTVLGDAALRARLVEEGLRDVRARFSWDTAMDAYRALLRM